MQFLLPDLAGFTAAAFLLLLACALTLLASVIQNSFGRAPVIGSWVSANIVGWLTAAAASVISAASATWHFAAGMFNWAQDILLKPFVYTLEFATSAWQWLNLLFTQTIPDAEARALNYAAGLVQSANVYATAEFARVESDLVNAVTGAEQAASGLFATATAYASTLFDRAESDLAADITRVQALALSEVTSVAAALGHAVTTAETTAAADLAGLAASANGAISQLARDIIHETDAAEAVAASNLIAVQRGIYTDLETWGDQAVSQAWPDAEGDITSLRRTLGADFPWLNDLLGALGGLGAAGLAGALIRSIAGAHAVTRLADDCIIPNCRNLSGLGSDLSNLLADASTAAMLAWFIFLVTDPAGWAAETFDVAGPVATAATHAAATVLGQVA